FAAGTSQGQFPPDRLCVSAVSFFLFYGGFSAIPSEIRAHNNKRALNEMRQPSAAVHEGPARNPLESLSSQMKDDLDAVNALILVRMQSEIPLIPELAGHLIAAGGKRIRPLLPLACAAACGYKGTRQHKL